MAWTCPCCGHVLDRRPDPERIVESLHLGPFERRVAALLARRFGQWISADQLADTIYGGHPDGGPLMALRRVSDAAGRARRKLASTGTELRIDGDLGRASRGYRMVWDKV